MGRPWRQKACPSYSLAVSLADDSLLRGTKWVVFGELLNVCEDDHLPLF